MTKKNALLIVVALGVLAAGWYFMNKKPVEQPTTTGSDTIETVRVNYVSMTGESVVVEYTGSSSAVLRSDDVGIIRFNSAPSASGARYVSADNSLVLWNKGNEVTISRGDEAVFVGTKPAANGEESPLTAKSWKWVTNEGIDEVSPVQKDAFVLTFKADGNVSGTTDCNSFSGAYDVVIDGSLSFGVLASTKKFCDGAQESEYFEFLRRVTSYAVSENELVLVIAGGETTMKFTAK